SEPAQNAEVHAAPPLKAKRVCGEKMPIPTLPDVSMAIPQHGEVTPRPASSLSVVPSNLTSARLVPMIDIPDSALGVWKRIAPPEPPGFTSNLPLGVVVPIPTLPAVVMAMPLVASGIPLELATNLSVPSNLRSTLPLAPEMVMPVSLLGEPKATLLPCAP